MMENDMKNNSEDKQTEYGPNNDSPAREDRTPLAGMKHSSSIDENENEVQYLDMSFEM